MSLVFQNIDPPSPSPPGEWVLPPNKGGGYTLARRRGGWGVNILEDERAWMKEEKGIRHHGKGAYLRCPVFTTVHFSLHNEGSSEYI
jgi:hypothetical protein